MHYTLAESCQNTFLLADLLEIKEPDQLTLDTIHSCLKKEDRDDALILVDGEERHEAFYVQMVVLGQDKEIAEFCGNGARAVAAYLFQHYPDYERYYLKTKKGERELLKHADGCYSVLLPPACLSWNQKFVSNPQLVQEKYCLSYAETGTSEPHLTMEKELSDDELFQMGAELNRQKELFPFGINLNCWHQVNEQHIFVKTYERGVQRLTKSCGTGSIACAVAFRQATEPTSLVHVSTLGGELKISFVNQEIELFGKSTIEKIGEALYG